MILMTQMSFCWIDVFWFTAVTLVRYEYLLFLTSFFKIVHVVRKKFSNKRSSVELVIVLSISFHLLLRRRQHKYHHSGCECSPEYCLCRCSWLQPIPSQS